MAVPATLTVAAQAVIDAFNKPDYVNLIKTMEHDVTLKRVLFSDSVSGIGNVYGYLTFHMFDRQPRLVNSTTIPPFNPPFPPYNPGGDLKPILIPSTATEQTALNGQVTGTGIYLDDNTGNQTNTKISFTLSFVRKNTNEEWSLVSSSVTLI